MNVTINDIAAALDIPEQSARQLMAGIVPARKHELQRIAECTGFSIDDLLESEGCHFRLEIVLDTSDLIALSESKMVTIEELLSK